MNRCDNWTEREDQILAKTVLNYVRDGKTQLQAFDDVGDWIDRSGGACGYRWNFTLRKSYVEELKIARRIRRGQKVEMSNR